jgi:transcriptional regulator with XRE-family HTH domain
MKLKQYREAMNISAKDAARDLSTSTVTLWRWETGKSIPDIESMRLIAKWSKGTVTANDFYEV